MATDAKRIELLRLISASRNTQIAGIATLRDAATLAVEQVQDTRIRMLEKPSTVRAAQEALFEIFLGYVLTPIVAKPVSELVESLLDHLLRTRLAFNVIPRSDLGQKVATRIAYTIVEPKNLARQFLRQADEATIKKLYRVNVHEALNEMYDRAWDLGRKASEVLAPQSSLESEDSGGVRVLGDVQRAAMMQHSAVSYHHDLLEIWVREAALSREQSENLDELLRAGIASEPSPYNLLVYRDHLRMQFEAVIWTLIFWDELDSGVTGVATTNIRLEATTPELSSYLAKRLVSKTGETFWEHARARERDAAYANVNAVKSLCTYLQDSKRQIKTGGGLLGKLVPATVRQQRILLQ